MKKMLKYPMNKKLKIMFLAPFGLLLCTLALVFIFEQTKAQDSFTYTKPNQCTWIIPLGNAEMETFYVIEDLYKSYKTLQNYLNMAENVGLELTASLNQNKNKEVKLGETTEPVCDFDKCKANDCYFGDCETMAFDYGTNDIDLKVCLYEDAICKEIGNMCVSLCKELPCIGEPCPVLGSVDEMGAGGGFLQTLRVVQSGIADEFTKVESILRGDKVVITYETVDERQNDKVGTTVITRIENIERLANIARAWLTPWKGDKGTTPTCALNDREMALLEQGKQLPREPMACSKALQEGTYWPPATSPFCETQCVNGVTEECQNCLSTINSPSFCGSTIAEDKPRNISWLADVNCQLYNDCKAECLSKTSLDLECYNCMCSKFVEMGEVNNAKCQDWLCGGSVLNFVCCE